MKNGAQFGHEAEEADFVFVLGGDEHDGNEAVDVLKAMKLDEGCCHVHDQHQ